MRNNSSWRDMDPALQHLGHPSRPDLDIALSGVEFSMLQQIRMLGSGLYILTVSKDQNGRDGLRTFRVVEQSDLTPGKS